MALEQGAFRDRVLTGAVSVDLDISRAKSHPLQGVCRYCVALMLYCVALILLHMSLAPLCLPIRSFSRLTCAPSVWQREQPRAMCFVSAQCLSAKALATKALSTAMSSISSVPVHARLKFSHQVLVCAGKRRSRGAAAPHMVQPWPLTPTYSLSTIKVAWSTC